MRKDTYDVYRGEELLMKNVLFKDLTEITQNLVKATKEKPLGHTKAGRVRLNTFKKLHLVGMYVVKN